MKAGRGPASEVSIPQWFLMAVGGPASIVSITQYLQKGGRTSDGRPYLGAAVGSRKFVEKHVESKVNSWLSVCAI